MKKRFSIITVISAIIIALLSGCSSYSARMWSGNQYPGKFNASFSYFNGNKYSSISVKEGQTLTLNYKSDIEEGEFKIKLYDSDKELEAEIEKNTEDIKEFKIEKGGKYKLEIVGEKAKGSFDISWKTE